MKAVYITKHGGPEVLIYGDLPEPNIGPNEVKVKVQACGINRLDLFTRAGKRGTRLNLAEPHILGGDASGDVIEIGNQVSKVTVGDRVVVNPRLTCSECRYCIAGEEEYCLDANMLGTTTNGSYAEYVNVPAVNTVPLPQDISYEDAAALPTVFLPSWNMLLRRASLKPWETVLILSASSGVGSAAIQVAKKIIGARVIATTSTQDKAIKASNLGADEVIQYPKSNIKDCVMELTNGQGVDVVVDHVGTDFWKDAFASLAPGGRYGICGVTSGYLGELHLGQLFLKNQTVFGVFMGRKNDLRNIVDMVSKRKLSSVIHDILPLESAINAHELMESRTTFGKLVLKMP